MKIKIFDTTLRDGAQSQGIAFSLSDKIKIITYLDELGVDFIEAGNPFSNPKDKELFQSIKNLKLKNTKVLPFGSTHKKGVTAENDENLISLLSAETEYVSIFGKAIQSQVIEVLNVSLEKNLLMISNSIDFLVKNGKKVIFDAEHFYDGYAENAEYSTKVIETALLAGAEIVTLCDTKGATKPLDIYEITKKITALFPNKIGIHCHNDTGNAIANSELAVCAGAILAQGTVLGIGERCGNCDIITLSANLITKYNYSININLKNLTEIAKNVTEIFNIPLPDNVPYVGRNAFTHKGGMHVHAMTKSSKSYEHIDPQLVGNQRNFVVSEISGREALHQKLNSLNIHLSNEIIGEILNELKLKESEGYHYENCDASFELFVLKKLNKFLPYFELVEYTTKNTTTLTSRTVTAKIIIKVKDKQIIAEADGNGPVNALDTALRKALIFSYPQIKNTELADYKVRVLDSSFGTDSKVRVLIETTSHLDSWITLGVSTDIIFASFIALTDSIEYYLARVAKIN